MRRIGVKAHGWRRVAIAGTTTSVAVLSLAGCGSGRTAGGSAQTNVPAIGRESGVQPAPPVTFGTGSANELLTLVPAGNDTEPVVQESVARSEIDHPQSAPKLLRQVLFTKARATASMLGWSGTGSAPVFRATLAWVGVFEVDPQAPHSCPAQPPPSPVSLPPLQEHYYFAVLIDATTGAQATWNEDASGLVMRQCAELWSSRGSRS